MDSSDSELDPVERLADEFVERQRRGERPAIDEYVRRYPELATEIRDVFPALLMMEQIAPASSDLELSRGTVQSPDHRPFKQIGDYRILREIGRGGMGVVYEAEQQSLRRRVALKVLPRQISANAKLVERFQREARAAARMHHTNIVPVFEVGRDDETVFYAMQLIHGQGLDVVIEDVKRLRSGNSIGKAVSPGTSRGEVEAASPPGIAASLIIGRFQGGNVMDAEQRAAAGTSRHPVQTTVKTADPPEDPIYAETLELKSSSTVSAVLPGQSEVSASETNRAEYFRSVARIGLQTAQALSYAHARGIIHRDIKPSNLLLDSAGVVWITDFGLAKTGDESMTHTGDILGTLRYMSPERFRGQCDVRADVYALGLTLYEMLLLRPAFESADRLKLIEMISRSEPTAPRSIEGRIPRDLETIVLKSIDKEPRRRYQSADELAEDLQLFIHNDPIKARRISLPERFVRWSRKNKALAASLLLAATLVLALAIGSTLAAAYFKRQEGIQRGLVQEKTGLSEKNQQLALDRQRALEAELESGRRLQTALAQEQLARQLAQTEEAKAQQERRRAQLAEQAAQQEAERSRALLYSSTVQLASFLWENETGTAAAVEQLLASCVAQEDEEDLRDFSWRYQWRRLRHSAQFNVVVFPTPEVAISPEGNLLTLDGRPELGRWDDDERTPVQTNKLETEGPATHGRLSPDGFRLAIVTGQASVQLFDTATGQSVQRLEAEGRVSRMEFAPDGQLLGTLSSVGNSQHQSVQVWDVSSGELRHTIQIALRPEAGFALSPDGERVLMARHPQHGYITAYSSDVSVAAVSLSHTSTVHSVAWSPDGRTAASGDTNGKISVWDTQSWERITTIGAHGHRVTGLVFSRDATRLASASQDGLVSVWEIDSGQRQRMLKGHTAPVVSLAFGPGDTKLASGSTDGVAKLWDLSTSNDPRVVQHRTLGVGIQWAREEGGIRIRGLYEGSPSERSGHLKVGDLITAIARGDDGDMKKVTGLSVDQINEMNAGISRSSVRLRIVRDSGDGPAEESEVPLVPEAFVVDSPFNRICCSRDGKWLATASLAGAGLCELPSGQLAKSLPYAGNAIAFAPDNSLLAINHGNTVKFWDLNQEQELHTWDVGGPLGSLVFSPSGDLLAAGPGLPFNQNPNIRTPVRIWDMRRSEEIQSLAGHRGSIPSVTFSPDGALLASASQDNTVRIWNVADWSEARTLTPPKPRNDLQSVTFSPDGKTVVAGDSNGVICLWHVEDGELIDTLDGHGFSVNGLAVSPDGRLLASASWDQTVKLWNLNSHQEVCTLSGHTDWINHLSFTPDGGTLISAGNDGTLRFWDTSSLKDIDEDPFMLRSLHKLALKYHRRQEADKARALFRRIIAIQERVLGETHIDTLESITHLGGSYFNEERYEEAASIWSDVLQRSLRELGEQNARTRLVLSNLQLASSLQLERLRKEQDLQKARSCCQRAVAMLTDALGADHAAVARWRVILADLLVEAGDRQSAADQWSHARRILEARIKEDPSNLADARSLGNGLLKFATDWTILEPTELKSEGGEEFTLEKDGSVFVSGPNPVRAIYTLKFRAALPTVTAICIETLPDPRLPEGGAGRFAENGNFTLSRLTAALEADASEGNGKPLEIAWATADHSKQGNFQATHIIDGDPRTWWETWPQQQSPHWVIVGLQTPPQISGGSLTITLDSGTVWREHGLGRFRVLATGDPSLAACAEVARGEVAGLTALAVSRAARRDTRRSVESFVTAVESAGSFPEQLRVFLTAAEFDAAYSQLRERFQEHPALPLTDVRWRLQSGEAIPEDFRERAIAAAQNGIKENPDAALTELPSLLIDFGQQQRAAGDLEAARRWDEAGVALLRRLAGESSANDAALATISQVHRAFLRAGHWNEAAECSLISVELKPEDTMAWLDAASALVLAKNEAAYRDLCHRMLQRFGATKDAVEAERTCKVCLLQPQVVDADHLPWSPFTASLDAGTSAAWFRSWGWGTRALLALRNGDPESVGQYIQKSQHEQPEAELLALLLAVRALAHHQLGQLDEARQDVSNAALLVNRMLDDGKQIVTDVRIARILLEEALATVHTNGRGNSATSTNPGTD